MEAFVVLVIERRRRRRRRRVDRYDQQPAEQPFPVSRAPASAATI